MIKPNLICYIRELNFFHYSQKRRNNNIILHFNLASAEFTLICREVGIISQSRAIQPIYLTKYMICFIHCTYVLYSVQCTPTLVIWLMKLYLTKWCSLVYSDICSSVLHPLFTPPLNRRELISLQLPPRRPSGGRFRCGDTGWLRRGLIPTS